MDWSSHAQCLGMDDLISMEAHYGLVQPCSVPGHGLPDINGGALWIGPAMLSAWVWMT
ncbi:hypothetical protein DPMN_073645 [Dreissena polymorpha]|uniref:Uncharacterized protein n=1 Tax=Dreissena polymorpha TaxID=45954 RepID=A0A9D4BZG2_DREPO|nr:hypothetical protein DPMN_073645 [Dreissena polymorpha]